jgi:hypothetical protein
LSYNSCGYKPTSVYVRDTLKGKVYITVDIDMNNARNSVLIKDALIDLLIGRFNLLITPNKQEANSFVKGKIISIKHKELQADTSGFAKVYRETIKIQISYNKRDSKVRTFTLSSYYDFTVDTDSTVTESKKDEAISIAISKALKNIFSKIAIKSYK